VVDSRDILRVDYLFEDSTSLKPIPSLVTPKSKFLLSKEMYYGQKKSSFETDAIFKILLFFFFLIRRVTMFHSSYLEPKRTPSLKQTSK